MSSAAPTLTRCVAVAAIVVPSLALAQMATGDARAPAQGPDEDRPWRAHEALGSAWLRGGLEHRTRFEHLEHDFRATNRGDATALSMRTLASAELRFLPVVMGAELQDSRVWASEGTPLNTTLANPLELLQAHVGLRGEDVLARGDSASLSAGRMTLDLGSRRLVARNEFRNTINAFTGVDIRWTSPGRDLLRGFAVTPVVRLPSAPAALERNEVELDRERLDALLWAVFFQSRPLARGIALEAYVLGLHERDSDIAPSGNRRLFTPGARALRAPAPGELDFQVEVMGQLGHSRATASAADVADLDHLAFSLHASTGYRFDIGWALRMVLQYDYASGDGSPEDGANGRFDPLFGARRFEFGPTGLYGAVARSNLSSPGVRFEVQPHPRLDAFTAYRLLWLASDRDAWTTAALRDPGGSSGSHVGQQIEARARWHLLPGNVSFELAGAALVRGEFTADAPGARHAASLPVYTQATGTI